MAPIRLIALGNGVWLDEIRAEGKHTVKDVPGGSVTFATLGARLFLPQDPQSVALVFNAGHDFPEAVIELFRGWSVEMMVEQNLDKPSSRGLVFYEQANANRKGFQRLTEPMPVTISDLGEHPAYLQSQAFHFFGTAEYIEEQVTNLLRCRTETASKDISSSQPLLVWEPHAKSCLPETLQQHVRAVRLVNVFSPNHEELHRFFGDSLPFNKQVVEEEAQVFVDAGIGPTGDGCMVVRAAGSGCLLMSRSLPPTWMPSYYDSNSEKVVDPTGAGNAFLGGFMIGFQATGLYKEAACYGQVAASFMLEQIGLPSCVGNGVSERWNGENVQERLGKYRRRYP
ncbi:hypothetical protein LTR78_007953 [Recurvomyces mirabilis]|uniref:Carbohydrate kinase PfkB domain-containing protein n=1 Tax=Recurvomyces mirabilis TaxID=574656 RepID=A0AAE0TTS4_9PEZI|nr:hypothetical protein LTR78_007953 [Recurvomyces mirabilis]KAK5152489.1 hypothetical protein LTS14_008436 [Recurvomyces mirabilis]